jgi:hypothetical protein
MQRWTDAFTCGSPVPLNISNANVTCVLDETGHLYYNYTCIQGFAYGGTEVSNAGSRGTAVFYMQVVKSQFSEDYEVLNSSHPVQDLNCRPRNCTQPPPELVTNNESSVGLANTSNSLFPLTSVSGVSIFNQSVGSSVGYRCFSTETHDLMKKSQDGNWQPLQNSTSTSSLAMCALNSTTNGMNC